MLKQDVYPCGYQSPHALSGLPADTPVLLAFSGGADSASLLHVLHEASSKEGFPLLLAHVNHGIRREEGLRDRAFCCERAAHYGHEICVLDADVPAMAAESGRGLEEEARRVRYAYFAKLMRERNIPLLVTAHHADDHLETVLFRICRGTGLKGLCGIAPTREVEGGILARPLLHVTKEQIKQYCREQRIPYVTDSTNADTSYARNRIRREVVPALRELFDGIAERTVAMSEALREDEECLAHLTADFLKDAVTDGALDEQALRTLPIALQKRALRTWVESRTGYVPERTHLQSLLALTQEEHGGQTRVALSGGVCAVKEFGRLRVIPDREDTTLPYRIPFRFGTTEIEGTGIVITVEPEGTDRKVHSLSTENRITSYKVFGIIEKDLYWRSRREGDTILMGGMHRKLRKLYNANKIPTRLRECMPLLCDGEGVLLAPFVGCRDGLTDCGEAYVISVVLTDRTE